MNNHVKQNSSASYSNPVTGSTLRRSAYAWHLNSADRLTACQAIFRAVSARDTGPFTAQLLEWLSAKNCLGMQILLGYIADQSSKSRLDEAEIFNKINFRSDKPLMATLKDGCHLNRFLCRLASNRMLDVTRRSWRIVLAEDCGEGDATRTEKFYSLSAACDAVEHREEQTLIFRLVQDACKKAGKQLADRVFARFVEDYDNITQTELAQEFGITQCKVNRILKRKRADLRKAMEQDVDVTVPLKSRKPRRKTGSFEGENFETESLGLGVE